MFNRSGIVPADKVMFEILPFKAILLPVCLPNCIIITAFKFCNYFFFHIAVLATIYVLNIVFVIIYMIDKALAKTSYILAE